LRNFMQITSTTEAEALPYLRLTQYNLDRSIDKYHIDKNTPKWNRSRIPNEADGGRQKPSTATEASPILQSAKVYSYNNSFTTISPKSPSPERARETDGLFGFF